MNKSIIVLKVGDRVIGTNPNHWCFRMLGHISKINDDTDRLIVLWDTRDTGDRLKKSRVGCIHRDHVLLVVKANSKLIPDLPEDVGTPKLKFLWLNLVHFIVYYDKPKCCNSVVAIGDKNKNIVVIRPEYREEQDSIMATIHYITMLSDSTVTYGDAFRIDTWDNKIARHDTKVVPKYTHSYFELRTENGMLDPSGRDFVSQYMKRRKMFEAGEITQEEIYGLEQVREHAQIIRNTKGEYADYWSKTPLRIAKITTTTEEIEDVPAL